MKLGQLAQGLTSLLAGITFSDAERSELEILGELGDDEITERFHCGREEAAQRIKDTFNPKSPHNPEII